MWRTKNTIKRTDTILQVKLLKSFPFGKSGDIITITKDENGWHGNGYLWNTAFLRNGELCKIR